MSVRMIGMRRFILLMMVCGLCLAGYSQTPAPSPQREQNRLAPGTPATGTVHAAVTEIADPSNSYALYLPLAYSPVKRWPLLLVFDPFARGEVSVKLFHEAAEKYGFIVVGSNNSRNFQDPSAAIRLLWEDVKERYAIDPRRIYTAGLSGGARVASSVALACKNCIAGVIANGAGLPQGAAMPGPEVTDWFLVAGTTDFNYPELLHLKESLETHNAASRFVIYDGPHNWMPKEFAELALAWLQLRAMVKGLAPADKEFLGQQFDRRLAEAQLAQKSGDILAATRAYREIVQDFHTLRDVKEQEAAAKSLAESEEFRKAKKVEKATLELQDEVATKIGNLVAGIAQRSDDRAAFVSQLQSAVNNAYRDERENSNPARKQAIERGLASAFAFAAESGQQAMLKKDFLSAKDMFQAGETILPESAWASYLLATAEAQMGEKKQAIQELKKALEKGMTNAKALDDSAFDRMREDEGFKQIAAKLTAVPKN
jgi:dienelactone hydrolase